MNEMKLRKWTGVFKLLCLAVAATVVISMVQLSNAQEDTTNIVAFSQENPVASVSVSTGTQASDISLPEKLDATVERDGTQTEETVAVTWESASYNPDVAGTYTFEASFAGYSFAKAHPFATVVVEETSQDEDVVLPDTPTVPETPEVPEAPETPEATEPPATEGPDVDTDPQEPPEVTEDTPAATAVSTGSCGDNLTWSYDNATGAMTISGTGPMNGKTPQVNFGNDVYQNIKTVVIGNGADRITTEAFSGCSSLESITIPNSVTYISAKAFQNCTSLDNVILPDSVKTMGNTMFLGCTSLKNIKLPDAITTIAGSTFSNCTSLETITIPNSVTALQASAFFNCSALENVILPNKLTAIDTKVFYQCTSLTSITIPASVTSIGTQTFQKCKNIPNGSFIFENADNLQRLGYSDIYWRHDSWKSMIEKLNPTSLVLPEITTDYDGSQTISGFESTKVGNSNNPTWLNKSAKWVDEGKSKANMQIDLSLTQMTDVDFVFVLDRSGSMQGGATAKYYNALSTMVNTTQVLLNSPKYNNRVSVVEFDSNATSTTGVPGTDSGFFTDDEILKEYLFDDGNIPTGSTNYQSAFDSAYSLIKDRADTHRPAYVVFLTDGAPDTGREGLEEAMALRTGNAADGVQATSIYTLAYDTDSNPILEAISDGNVFSASSAEDLEQAFTSIITDALSHTFDTLVDPISENFTASADASTLRVEDEEGTIIPGAAVIQTGDDGVQNIVWNLSELQYAKKYKLIAELSLKTGDDGGYPGGVLATNGGLATIKNNTGGTMNTVDSPELSRDATRELRFVTDVRINSWSTFIPATPDYRHSADGSVEITMQVKNAAGIPLAEGTSFQAEYKRISDGATTPVELVLDAEGKATLNFDVTCAVHGDIPELMNYREDPYVGPTEIKISGLPELGFVSFEETPSKFFRPFGYSVRNGNEIATDEYMDHWWQKPRYYDEWSGEVDLTDPYKTLDIAMDGKNRSVYFLNEKLMIDGLHLTKLDAEDLETPLAGAEFSLYEWQGEGKPSTFPPTDTTNWVKVQHEVSDDAGKLAGFSIFRDSYYVLVEDVAPDGYVKPSGAWLVKSTLNPVGVRPDGTISFSASMVSVEPVGDHLPPAFVEVGHIYNTEWKFIVPNIPTYMPPMTGGEGTLVCAVVGALLVASAGCLLIVHRSRRSHGGKGVK